MALSGFGEPPGALLDSGTTTTAQSCPAGYSAGIVCPQCVGVTRECLSGTICCRCVGTCTSDGQPSPTDGQQPQDPWARLVNLLPSLLGGGGAILAPQPQQVAVVPTTRREIPVWGWLLLAAAGGLGLWWWMQRRGRRAEAAA
jgi:hypothetical protein